MCCLWQLCEIVPPKLKLLFLQKREKKSRKGRRERELTFGKHLGFLHAYHLNATEINEEMAALPKAMMLAEGRVLGWICLLNVRFWLAAQQMIGNKELKLGK